MTSVVKQTRFSVRLRRLRLPVALPVKARTIFGDDLGKSEHGDEKLTTVSSLAEGTRITARIRVDPR